MLAVSGRYTDPDALRVGASDWYLVLAQRPDFAALVAARSAAVSGR